MIEKPANNYDPSVSSTSPTVLGRNTEIRGQVTGTEDLVIEGQFDGNITLQEHCLTVGSEGKVKAEIQARQVVVMGNVTGNITARDKILIRRTGHVLGDLMAGTVAIEDGAYFKGKINISRDESPSGTRSLGASKRVETPA